MRPLSVSHLSPPKCQSATIVVPAIAAGIDAWSWRATLLCLASLLAAVNLPLYAFVRRQSRPASSIPLLTAARPHLGQSEPAALKQAIERGFTSVGNEQ